jgi:hypothetical protein
MPGYFRHLAIAGVWHQYRVGQMCPDAWVYAFGRALRTRRKTAEGAPLSDRRGRQTMGTQRSARV